MTTALTEYECSWLLYTPRGIQICLALLAFPSSPGSSGKMWIVQGRPDELVPVFCSHDIAWVIRNIISMLGDEFRTSPLLDAFIRNAAAKLGAQASYLKFTDIETVQASSLAAIPRAFDCHMAGPDSIVLCYPDLGKVRDNKTAS